MIHYAVKTFVIDEQRTRIMRECEYCDHRVCGSVEHLTISHSNDTVDWERIANVGRKLIAKGDVAFWIIRHAQQKDEITYNTEVQAFRHPDIWECNTGKKNHFIKCEIKPMVMAAATSS